MSFLHIYFCIRTHIERIETDLYSLIYERFTVDISNSTGWWSTFCTWISLSFLQLVEKVGLLESSTSFILSDILEKIEENINSFICKDLC